MSQDYAKKSARDPKSSHSRNQSASRTSEQNQSSSFKPFLAGSIFGVLACLGVQWLLAGNNASELAADIPETLENIDIDQAAAPVLDFYTRLREVEVLVPEEALETETLNLLYLLQAGSFREASDADNMRAQLILLNLNAEISKFNHNGEIWHRVIVGPFEDRSTMSKTRTTLLENGIESLLLTQQIDG